MEITQDHINFAAEEESKILSQTLQQAQIQVMNDRIVTLRAYAKALEELCEENDIDYALPEKAAVEEGGNVTELKKPADRKPRTATKKTAASKKKKE